MRLQKTSSTTPDNAICMDINELDKLAFILRPPFITDRTSDYQNDIDKKENLYDTQQYVPEMNNASGSYGQENLPYKTPPYDLYYEAVMSSLDSSTIHSEKSEEVNEKILTIFNEATEENFEDGIESEFSNSLIFNIIRYGNDALKVVKDLITEGRINSEIASEALRWFGLMEHPYTYESRLSFLEECLFNPSLYIRDGALLGISFLDDPKALPYLKEAFRLEKCSEFKDEMKVVIEQLEETFHAISS